MSETPIGVAPEMKPERKSRPRILAVDDQPDSLRLLQIRLEAGGMECVSCTDGPSALKYLEDQTVDVVILDVMMPRMDGYEVCRRIKGDDRTRDIPVIFLTAKLETTDKVQGLDVGGHDYLSKPVNQQELLARTRAALRVKELQDQLKEQMKLQAQVHRLHREMLSEHWQKTLGQLAASLAHEINNPLAAALGMVQLLRMQPGMSKNMGTSMQIIDQSLQRAGHKLRSLLLIAQPSRLPQKLALDRLIQDLVALVNYQAVMNKVTLKTEFKVECEWEGVPSDLARAILYILNNSIEAVAGKGDPMVTVMLDQTAGHGCIRVRDNGGGVAASIRDRVFTPFFTTKGPTHHGVGLYLANEIVQAAGGRIEIQSPAALAATEFIIHLPANQSAD